MFTSAEKAYGPIVTEPEHGTRPSRSLPPWNALRVAFVLAMLAPAAAVAQAPKGNSHEVWMLDQSNTHDSTGDGSLNSGGTLYILDGKQLAGNAVRKADAEVIPLGGAMADWIIDVTGAAPVRPHYIAFNASHTHAIISFVATGHVLILDAATALPVFVVKVGAQAHAAVPSPDETYILVANQNGKLLQRINTDYAANFFELDEEATLDLADDLLTPGGFFKQDDGVLQIDVRPDTAPILALPDQTSNLAFVTLRGGGLFVVNPRSTPMEIVAEYTVATIEPAGLLAIQKGDKLYFNSGGGGGAELGHQAILYRLPVSAFSTQPNVIPDSPIPTIVFDHSARPVKDSHGLMLTQHERYLWVADRAANTVVVVDTTTDAVVNEIDLAGAVSPDPAPDLLVISPAGNRAYATLRGPVPLTGNNPGLNNAQGQTPGLGVIRIEQAGRAGTLQGVFPVSNLDGDGFERADPHGIAVRRY